MRKFVRGGLLILALTAAIAMLTGNYTTWPAAVGGWLGEHVLPVWLGFWQWLVLDVLGFFPGVPQS